MFISKGEKRFWFFRNLFCFGENIVKLLTVKKFFGNGEVAEYTKVISGKPRVNYVSPEKGSLEEVYEKYRQKVKNNRLRAATRAMSYKFHYHTVFTTTNREISRNPELFIKLVTMILKKQNINYFLVLELNHPRTVWQYDNEEDKNEGIEKDEIINRYGCLNRICLAPLSEDEGFHIHVLTDRKVNFEEWIENYGGDPKNLYSELFYYQQIDNVNYILKYFYYTKSVLDDNFHIYRSNIKKIDRKIVISEKDLDSGIENVLYSSFEKEKEVETRIYQRGCCLNLKHTLCILNINLLEYIKQNYKFHNVLNRQNVMLFSLYHFNHFVSNIHIDTDVFIKCSKLTYSFYKLSLPTRNIVLSDVLSFSFCFINKEKVVETKKRTLKVVWGEENNKYNKIDTNKIEYRRKNSFDSVEKGRDFNIKQQKTDFQSIKFENWLLKYVVFIKTIPKNP